ncbi:hypothetical protein [Arthrobacter oryzae]|uniref:hypothetical protein n=1 Tax=Arthrobacter oryzae TaxID=409290 RepID=UPI00273C0655|nr:hypothetical protein [Arthrobacter oryzae]WLQ07145.1 hypothetical protein Q8Z05_03045 [Arthrobacter oryzae]
MKMSELAYRATTASEKSEPSAVLHSRVRSLPSTSHLHGTAHLRPAVKVPVRLSLAGIGSVTGSISVHLTISPVPPATPVTPAAGDVSVSFSYVEVGTVRVSPTLKRTGGTFTAAFTFPVAAGSTHLDFDFGGHSYRGRSSDHRDFSLTTEVTFHEHGKPAPTVLASAALIQL